MRCRRSRRPSGSSTQVPRRRERIGARRVDRPTRTVGGPNLKTLILFESLHARLDGNPKRRFDQVNEFATWIEGSLSELAAVLNDPNVSPADKQARLDGATQVRLYWDPAGGYTTTYGRMRTRIEKWFDQHKTELGVNYQALHDLVVFVEKPRVGHERMVRSGITESLTARSHIEPALLPAYRSIEDE